MPPSTIHADSRYPVFHANGILGILAEPEGEVVGEPAGIRIVYDVVLEFHNHFWFRLLPDKKPGSFGTLT